MIVDTSAILAILFEQQHAEWAADQLAAAGRVQMSTVNLTETRIHLLDRTDEADRLIARFAAMPIDFIPPDRAQAELAADARLRYPLNFGDCFAYALAKSHGRPLLTLDRDFRGTDADVRLPPD